MASALRREEGFGLALAIAAHVGLATFLLWRPPGELRVLPPERMTVTFSDDMSLTSTSPEPQAQAEPDRSPQIGEPQQAPQAVPEPAPAPPKPQPRAEPRPEPRPVARPEPRPSPRSAPRPVARPSPAPKPAAKPPSRPAPSREKPARPTTRPGSTSFSEAFESVGRGSQPGSKSTSPPAATAGPAVIASIGQAISRELKPHWAAPQGAEAELLVTKVRFRLARDGSLIGNPQIVSQSGVTAANEAQKTRHAEQAIRAVRLAAPFDLPEQYYSAWQTVNSTFDRRLSQ